MIAACSLADISIQYLLHDQGCVSSPDKLSHETWVNPNTTAAACSLLQADVGERASVRAIQKFIERVSKLITNIVWVTWFVLVASVASC